MRLKNNLRLKSAECTNFGPRQPDRSVTCFCVTLCRAAALIIFFTQMITSCGFVDLRPVGFSAFPDRAGAVLAGRNTAVGIRFDAKMDHGETQKAFSVTCNGAPVKGDLSWNNDELSFVPPEGWQAGLRYTLALDGTIFARDGRETRAMLYVPFYVLSANLPYLTGFSPADGASVEIVSGGEAALVLRFSVPMDRFSVEDAVIIDGAGEREFRWSDDDKTLEVLPKKSLSPWTAYRWTLSGKARSREGAPLAKEASGLFVTDADRRLPSVTEVYPLVRLETGAGIRWQWTGRSLEDGLGSGQAVGVCFNKAMDDSALRAIRFEPALTGRCERWTDSSAVFIPDRDPEPETVYTLIVSAGAGDVSGLKMAKDYRFCFIPDIPYLTLLSLRAGSTCVDRPANNGFCGTSVIMPEGLLGITIRFSHLFTLDAKTGAARLLRLEPYFPGVTAPASLRSVYWLDDTMLLEWEGAVPDSTGKPRYYRLVLPGGRGGVSDGRGSYLKEDFNFIVEVLN